MYTISNNRYFRLILQRNHRGSPPEHSAGTTSATHLQDGDPDLPGNIDAQEVQINVRGKPMGFSGTKKSKER